jgi:hypothetical protein
MPNVALIRSYTSADIDNPYKEGHISMTPDFFRYIQRSNVGNSNYDYTAFSYNSNGLFLNRKNNIYGKWEGAYSNFARIECSLSNGLIYGSGLGGDLLSFDYFKVSRNAEVSTYATDTNTMTLSINSNAEIQKGGLVIDKSGNLKVNGSNLILSSGAIQRRADPESSVGFQVSPNGFLTMGGLQVNTEGVLTSTQNISGSNFIESGTNLNVKYALSNTLSNVNSNLSGFSNWVSPITLCCSNNAVAFSNWVSPITIWNSNNTSNLALKT